MACQRILSLSWPVTQYYLFLKSSVMLWSLPCKGTGSMRQTSANNSMRQSAKVSFTFPAKPVKGSLPTHCQGLQQKGEKDQVILTTGAGHQKREKKKHPEVVSEDDVQLQMSGTGASLCFILWSRTSTCCFFHNSKGSRAPS